MKRLPVAVDAPIACTLAPTDVPGRVELLGRLRDAATSVERTAHGMVLRFPAGPDVEADVRRFAVEEQACCTFWAFEVAHRGDALVLRWDGPAGASDLLDGLHAHLADGAPLDDLAGLL